MIWVYTNHCLPKELSICDTCESTHSSVRNRFAFKSNLCSPRTFLSDDQMKAAQPKAISLLSKLSFSFQQLSGQSVCVWECAISWFNGGVRGGAE